MTSTNVYKGMNNGNRNSSRVLKPPGGGHTDILGLETPPETHQAKKSNPRNISSITEGTNMVVNHPAPVKAKTPVEPEKGPTPVVCDLPPPKQESVPVTPSAPVEKIESAPEPPAAVEKMESVPAPPVEAKASAPAAPPSASLSQPAPRGRVPPGGFSSGLW